MLARRGHPESMRRWSWWVLYSAGVLLVLGLFAIATRVHGWVLIPLIIAMFFVLLVIRVDQFDRLDQHLPPWLRQRKNRADR